MSLNHIRPWRNIYRRKSRQIMVGTVPVGGDAPITVQTMTNTDTSDVRATVDQVRRAAEAGADIVRVSTPDQSATRALREIVRESPVPIVADIHFHYKRAIEAAEAGAACLRINPGNIGDAARVKEVIRAAKDHGCSIRIGVNAGSLEKDLLEKYGEPCPEAMVESGLDHIRILQDNDFHEFKISCKASDVFLAAAAYQALADATDAPIHLGITEAGGLMTGTIKSAIGLGNVRVSKIRKPQLSADRRGLPRRGRAREAAGDRQSGQAGQIGREGPFGADPRPPARSRPARECCPSPRNSIRPRPLVMSGCCTSSGMSWDWRMRCAALCDPRAVSLMRKPWCGRWSSIG
jgi:hypothetical protein